MSQAELFLGDLPLVDAYPSGLPYRIETLAELDLGNPEPNVAEVQSFLEDGSLAQVINYGNRQPVIRVIVSADNLGDVAVGEAALMAEVRRGRNELRWTPPDTLGVETSVFDVVWTRLDFSFDDMDELRFQRTFVLTLTCLPWARPTMKNVVEAISDGGTPPTPVSAVVDPCTSLTGWSTSATFPFLDVVRLAGGTGPGVQAGLGNSGPGGPRTYALTRTLSVSMATTPLLTVKVQTTLSNARTNALRFEINGAPVQALAQQDTTFYFDCTDIPTVTSFKVSHQIIPTTSRPDVAHYATLTVFNISRTNATPFVGNGRQQFRSMMIPGSAPTTGSIQVADDTESLGYVAVYTNVDDQSGYQPPCRNLYRVAGTTPTVDPTAASGAWSKLNGANPETFDIPARALPPGTYQVMALLRLPVAGFAGCNWEASTRVGTTDLGVETKPNIVYAEPAGTLCDLGQVTLPSVGLPLGSSGMVRMKLSSNSTTLEMDDLYLFNLSTGALTLVSAGTGTPTTGGASSRLWIKAPSTDSPNPTTWLGTLADESDSRHTYGSKERTSLGTHVLTPGTMNVFTLTTGATYAAVSAEFYRRYHSNVMAE